MIPPHFKTKRKNISRLVLSVVITLILITTALGTTATIQTSQTATPQTITQLSYSFSFQEPTFNTISVESATYTLISLDGCMGLAQIAGEPKLPRKFVQLLLPPATTVTDIHISSTSQDATPTDINLLQSPVIPQQPSVPFGMESPDFIMDEQLYTTNQPQPDSLLQDYQIGYNHGYTILSFALTPVQYTPSQGTVTYHPEISVSIDLEETTYNQLYRASKEDKLWVQNLVSNPEMTDLYTTDVPTFDYPGGICDPSGNYDYVIITTTHNDLDYWDTTTAIPYNWESLMDKHLADDGLQCTLVTVQAIDAETDYHNSNPLFNDQTAHIREFCKDAYQDWGTQYILIGGDDEWIASREMDTNYEGNINSDIYWSNLDLTFNADQDNYWGEEGDSGFDLYAEIFIGRLTCDEPQDVSNWMTKSFYYADNHEMEYLNGVGFYGGNTGWNCQGDDFMDYSAVKGTDDYLGPSPGSSGPYPTWLGFQYGYETWNQVNPSNPFNITERWTAEPPNPGWKGGSETQAINGLKNCISNNAFALISGIAHANANMALDVYSSSWEADYHNTKPFFLHDYGCHCGDMDAADDGVLHSMLFHSDTELAYAVVFNTCYGWGNFDSTNSSSAVQTKTFWDYFLDVANNSMTTSNWQFAKAHAYSKDVLAPTINWDYSTGTWRAILQGCLYFGDPAQLMKSPNEVPLRPDSPSGPDEGVTGYEYSFSSTTTDPEGEDIFFMFDWGDNTTSGWLGPFSSGGSTQASHTWDIPDIYEVCVKAKDINGGESPWSEPLLLNVVQAPIMDVRPMSGGVLKVGTSVKNVGSVTATDVQWKITLTGGTILMGKESTGTVAAIGPGEQIEIKSGPIFGIGKTKVKIEAEVPESYDMREQSATIFLFYVHIVPGGG